MSCQLNKLAVAVALKVLLSDFFCCYKCTTVPSIKKVDVFFNAFVLNRHFSIVN